MKHDEYVKRLEEKRCTKCDVVKAIDSFALNGGGKRKARCKQCCSSYFRDIYYTNNRDKVLARTESYRKDNWERIKNATMRRIGGSNEHTARQAVNNAVKSGRFEKSNCDTCGLDNADFHHTNGYEKESWFVGVWLCRKHHSELHNKLRQELRNILGASNE